MRKESVFHLVVSLYKPKNYKMFRQNENADSMLIRKLGCALISIKFKTKTKIVFYIKEVREKRKTEINK